MSIAWVFDCIGQPQRIWVFTLLGLLMFVWGGWRKHQEALLASATFTLTGFACFWQSSIRPEAVYLPNLLEEVSGRTPSGFFQGEAHAFQTAAVDEQEAVVEALHEDD